MQKLSHGDTASMGPLSLSLLQFYVWRKEKKTVKLPMHRPQKLKSFITYYHSKGHTQIYLLYTIYT